MMMPDEEIARFFRQAKDPIGQRKILAELNLTSVEKIDAALRRMGVPIDGLIPPKDAPTPRQERYRRRTERGEHRILQGKLDEAAARRFWQEGCTDAGIGERLGVTPGCVGAWRRKQGLPPAVGKEKDVKKEDLRRENETAENDTETRMLPGVLAKLLTQAEQICQDVRLGGSAENVTAVEIRIRYNAAGEAVNAVVELR